MAYAMTKQGSLDNCVTYEFMCDTVEDMNRIENEYRTLGSVAIVLNGESGSLEVYITDSSKKWHNFSTASGGGSAAEGAGLKLHLCTQDEVEEGLPNISNPDENTIYLVSGSEEENNLYEEYFYIDDGWEKFGSAGISLNDISSIYAPIANPVFTGSISLGRKANTTVGAGSVAEGAGVTASGAQSHAEGGGTIAAGAISHVGGTLNVEDSYANWPEWTANTTYVVGDKVKRSSGSVMLGYVCTTANSDASFNSSKWTNQSGKMNYAEIIGNGKSTSARSNARALDWDGNEHLMGDLYVGCNADSTGGAKVATEAYVNARIPTPPTTNGTYILQAVVADGTTTYSWINLPAAQGVSF